MIVAAHPAFAPQMPATKYPTLTTYWPSRTDQWGDPWPPAGKNVAASGENHMATDTMTPQAGKRDRA